MPIIDAHAHYGEWFFPIYRTKPEDIVAIMKKLNIEAVIMSSSKAVLYDMVEGNRDLNTILENHEGFYGYVSVNPNYPELSKAEIRRYLDDPKFRGIGEVHPFYTGVKVNSKDFISIMEEAKNYEKPILIHAYSEGDIMAFKEIANRFPELIFIMAHMGGTDRSGTGKNWKTAISVARDLSNIYLETCMTILERDKIEEAVSEVGADRIVFGSDLTLINPAHILGMILDAEISNLDKEKILYRNAKRIFKL